MTEDIDYSILPEPFISMHRIHRYWGRKPWNVFREYTKNYTSENNIFLDPFCGSGNAIAEALILNRRVIGIDLNPIATFITRQMITPIDLLKFEHAFKKIVENVSQTITEEYSTQCRKCGTPSEVIHFKWERKERGKLRRLQDIKEEIRRDLKSITYNCPKCECRRKLAEKQDVDKSMKQYIKQLPGYLVNKKLRLSPGHFSEAKSYFDLFTPRNLFLASVIYDQIIKINDKKIQDLMKLVFTSSLAQNSRLIMYTEKGIRRGTKERSKSWIAPRFHIQKDYPEKNPLINFKNSFQTVLRAKKESNRVIPYCTFVDTFEDIVAGKGNVLIVTDDVGYLDSLPKNSIDYIIADPPFAKDIRYLELSQLWNIWLGFKPNYNDEIKYDEGHEKYTVKLTEAFKKMHRILKNGRHLTITYQTDDIKSWDTMVQTPVNAGFVLKMMVPQGVKYSTGAKYRALMKKGEHKLILGYYYLNLKKEYRISDIKSSQNNFANRIIKQVIYIISKRQEPTPLMFILLNLYKKMTSYEIKTYSTNDILKILESNNKIRQFKHHENPLWQKWTIKGIKFNRDKALEKLVRNDIEETLLYERGKFSSFYIQHILSKFKEDYIVSSQRVKRLLDNVSEPKNGGLVLKRNKNAIANRKRADIIEKLVLLGKKYSLKASKPKGDLEKSESVILWEKGNKRLIMFYITLTGVVPSHEIEKESKNLKKKFAGFQQIMIRPQSIDKEFADMTKHWDYIWLEDLEKLMYDKKIVDRFITKSQKQERIKKKKVKAIVIQNKEYKVNEETRYFKLVLDEPYIQNHAQPGQFINILCPTNNKKRKKLVFDSEKTYINYLKNETTPYSKRPLLRRPISIHRIYYKDFDPKTLKEDRNLPEDIVKILRSGRRDRFDVLIKVVGEGTKALSKIKPREKIDMIGPLGKPIEIDKDLRKALLVAGGIGIAPLYALAEELRWTGRKVVLFLGTYDEKDLKILGYDFHTDKGYAMRAGDAQELVREFADMGIKVILCTISGEIKGVKRGMVTEVFKKYLNNKVDSLNNTGVFSCGPKEMLKEIVKITKKFNLSHKVLLEERMGCGLGVCLSCVCPIKNNDTIEYKRICTEGPVFDAEKIAWDRC